MNKSEFITAMADKAELSKALKKNDKVSLVGFDTSAVRQRAARTGRNPKTGAPLKIATSKNPTLLHWLVLAVVLSGCSPNQSPTKSTGEASSASSRMLFLTAEPTRLIDEQGREVILRGFNHIALRADRTRPTLRDAHGVATPLEQLFDLQDIEDKDFDFIASTGVNTLRLVVTWEFAQPDPPPAAFNEAYFQLIDQFIAKAKARGLYVIFDFGQFGWGRSIGGNAGAPDWTVNATCRSLPNAPANAPPQASGSVGCAYYNFWTNQQAAGVALQDAYIDLWRFVARRYRDESAIAIYDLYNEPFGGPLPPGLFELAYLYPFYQKLSAGIREIDTRHTIAFQPEIFHSLGIPTPFATPLSIANSVYMPHEYTVAYFVQRVNPAYTPVQNAITRSYLNIAAIEAGIFQTPWMMGETGWTRSTSADGVGGPLPATDIEAPRQFARDFTQAADVLKVGWLWFAYSSVDEAYGINFGDIPDVPLITQLARPYPRAIAGHVQSFQFDVTSGEYLQYTTARTDQFSEIALPLAWQYPRGACIYDEHRLLGQIAIDGKVSSNSLQFDQQRQVLSVRPIPATLRITRMASTCPQ